MLSLKNQFIFAPVKTGYSDGSGGVQAIHVSAGSVCSTPPWYFQHMFIKKGKTWEMAKAIKEKIHIPVIFVGRINRLNDIEKIKNEYSADYIAIGDAKKVGNVQDAISDGYETAKEQ